MSHLPATDQIATDQTATRVSTPTVSPWQLRIRNLVASRSIAPIILAIILLVGAAFRLTGVNWDSGKRLHPDERFLTSVTADITWPEKLDTYFDPLASPLSPYSLENMGLWVYGTLPVWFVKIVAIALNQDTYDSMAIVGRVLSAIFDLLAIWLLYLFGRKLYGEKVALLGSGLLALSVLNIQQAHFYTVDTFANFFVVLIMFNALKLCTRGSWGDYAIVGLALGAGMASKLSVATLALPILLATAWDFIRRVRVNKAATHLILERTVLRLLTLVLLTGLTFRILQPVSFQGPEFWNFSLNPAWLEDVKEQSDYLTGENGGPPWLIQWADRPALIFPLQNMLLWGMGLPLGIAAWCGWGLAAYELIRKARWVHLLPVVYVGVTFIYHGTFMAKFMRYFLPVYPFLALFAAYLLVRIYQAIAAYLTNRAASIKPVERDQQTSAPTPAPVWVFSRIQLLAALPAVLVFGGTLIWALGFTSIYTRPHTRVEASRWMITNMPAGSVLANEHWDDWLPVAIDNVDPYGQKLFTGVEMPNYEDDTPEKLNRMVENLSQAQYVILSSNKLYDSIPRLPMRFPMTIRYYELLFSEQLGYRKVADFTSYPQFLGLRIPDQGAEESFSVYDHPRVQVFQKQPDFDAEKVRTQLRAGVDWDNVVRLTPKQASAAPDMLQLSSVDRNRYNATSIRLSPAPWAAFAQSTPLLFWSLALILIGLAALPLTLIAFGNLRDYGAPLARTLGLLTSAWLVWFLASQRWLPFTWWSSLLALVILAVVSWAIGLLQRKQLLAIWRTQRRPLLLQEGLFWLCFLGMATVRWYNPDLWSPGLGGEKPMDTAYLTAITNSPYFPAYDPWYAGGYINYYYFGFVLVATLIHLSGVAPTTAYNLAVPTLFALTAVGAASVAASLASLPVRQAIRNRFARLLSGSRGWLIAGIMGALFVTTIGNLGQVQLLWDGVQKLSTINPPGEPERPRADQINAGTIAGSVVDRTRELLLPIPRVADGLIQLAFNGKKLDFRQEWWYWNATRVFPKADDEAGPITEFPFFTFLFADLHAHMMALPLTLLALAIGVNIVRGSMPHAVVQPVVTLETASDQEPSITIKPKSAIRAWLERVSLSEVLILAIAALTIGALWPTNTWDFPTYAMLLAGAFGLRAYVKQAGVNAEAIWDAGWRWGVVVIGAFLLFKPFHDFSASAYFGAEQWKGSRTPLWAYLIVHGFFLFVLWSYMLSELHKSRNRNVAVRFLVMSIRWRKRSTRLRALVAHFATLTPIASLTVAVLPAIAGLLIALALLGYAPVALALLTATVALLLFFSPHPDPLRQMTVALIAIGALLTAVVEIIVLKGDISRMNTVFKFYLQVWVIWGVASAAVLPTLAARLGSLPAKQVAGLPPPAAMWQRRWWQAFGLLLAGCLLYTVTATPARIKDRFENVTATTFDGRAYMRTAIYIEQEQPVLLEYDRQAIEWMQRNIPGKPAIVEANTRPFLYHWGSRVSIYTGLPTIIGWDWHQKQQRSIFPGEWIDQRIDHVQAIYADPNPEVAQRLLRRYGVEYIYLGRLERIYHGGDGINKFAQFDGQLWDKVYENTEVQIYRVRTG